MYCSLRVCFTSALRRTGLVVCARIDWTHLCGLPTSNGCRHAQQHLSDGGHHWHGKGNLALQAQRLLHSILHWHVFADDALVRARGSTTHDSHSIGRKLSAPVRSPRRHLGHNLLNVRASIAVPSFARGSKHTRGCEHVVSGSRGQRGSYKKDPNTRTKHILCSLLVAVRFSCIHTGHAVRWCSE